MKLLFVIGYDLDRSPWATRPRAILKGILDAGHTTTVIDLEEPHKTHPPIHPPLKGSSNLTHIRLKQRYQTSLDAPLAIFQALRKTKPLIQQADVVHIQKPKLLTWAIARQAARQRKPIVYDWDDLEGSGGIRSGWSAWKVDRIERFFARNSQTIVAASIELQRFIEKTYPDHAPIIQGPCGVDLEQFNPERISPDQIEAWRTRLNLHDEEKVILYHGQLEMGAPGDLLVAALGKIIKTHPVRLVLVGGGARQEAIIEKAQSAGLGDHLTATGYVPFEEIPTLLTLANIALALLPDNAYARCKSPLKIYEAMAMGTPLIATSIGQAAEVLQGCAKLVPPDDAESLVQALSDYLHNPQPALELAQAARDKAVRDHNWKRLGETFLDLYNKAG